MFRFEYNSYAALVSMHSILLAVGSMADSNTLLLPGEVSCQATLPWLPQLRLLVLQHD